MKMTAVSRFESLMEGLVERSFTRLFRSRLQPIEIAKKIVREMEAGRVVGVSSVLVPNDYQVSLSPEDFATFASIRGALEGEMASYVAQAVADHRYTTVEPPLVSIVCDDALHPRQVVVTGRLHESHQAAAPATERLNPTQTMPRAPVAEKAMRPVGMPGEAYLSVGDLTYPLSVQRVAVGRGLENTIVIEDRRVSRLHAVLVSSGGNWSVRDEGSTNGTFLNNRRVTQHALRNGDQLSLGGLEMVFRQRWEGS